MAKVFERVIVVFLENTLRTSALANPYLNALRQKGVFMTNAQGITHPSQPNYIATIAGDTMGIVDDENHYMDWYWNASSQEYVYNTEGFSPETIVDLLEANNLSWKCYVEDLPSGFLDKLKFDTSQSPQVNLANVPADTWPFARRHVPFLSFPGIVANQARLSNIVGIPTQAPDHFTPVEGQGLDPATLPHFSLYIPNLLNDGHNVSQQEFRSAAADIDLGPNDGNLDNMERFLKGFLGDDPVSKFPPETLVVITFDESYPYQFDYGIYTLLIGDFLEAGTINTQPVNHYSLLRTIEDNFGIGSLKRHDAMARPYWFLKD